MRASNSRRNGASASSGFSTQTSAPTTGFTPLATASLIKLDHAKQVGQIAQAKRRHAVGHGAADGLVQADNAVSDGEFRMQAKMYKARVVIAVFYPVR